MLLTRAQKLGSTILISSNRHSTSSLSVPPKGEAARSNGKRGSVIGVEFA
jgi:hypothetical protein